MEMPDIPLRIGSGLFPVHLYSKLTTSIPDRLGDACRALGHTRSSGPPQRLHGLLPPSPLSASYRMPDGDSTRSRDALDRLKLSCKEINWSGMRRVDVQDEV